MKVDTSNISDLVQIGENKRKQLVPQEKEEATLKKPVAKKPPVKQDKKTAKPDEVIIYRHTKLKLPDALKRELDHLFAEHQDLRELGKNEFLTQAVEARVRAEKKRRN